MTDLGEHESVASRDGSREIYTIGHSNVSAERLIEVLRQHRILNVVDVRSTPVYSFPDYLAGRCFADLAAEVK